MSRNVHDKSNYVLTKMPNCSKCKAQLILSYGLYEGSKEAVKEWECTKCGRVFTMSQIPEPKFSEEDKWLNEWCKRNTTK